jgi:hypothetical protein
VQVEPAQKIQVELVQEESKEEKPAEQEWTWVNRAERGVTTWRVSGTTPQAHDALLTPQT